MLNSVILLGRLTHDPELKMSSNQIPVVTFGVAVPREGKNSSADFIDCVAFRRTAEFVSSYFRKGQSIIIQGTLLSGSYTGQDGKTRKSLKVIVNNVSFTLASKAESASEASDTLPTEKPGLSPITAADFSDVEDEDLPF